MMLFLSKSEFTFVLVFIMFFVFCAFKEVSALSLKNSKTKERAMSAGTGPHKPSYNPGGDDFANDTEFYQSYQSKYNYNNNLMDTDYSGGCENRQIPGNIIDHVYIEKIDRRELQDIHSKKYYCVQNRDIPEELSFLIESECEQEVIMNSNQNKPYPEKKILISEYKGNKKFDEMDFVDYNPNNQNADECEFSNENEEKIPSVKFKS